VLPLLLPLRSLSDMAPASAAAAQGGSQAGRAGTEQETEKEEDLDFYQVLGLTFEASDEEIRKQYHSIVRTLHPDRRRPGGTGGNALERFHQVQSAWRVLADPTRRLLYDLRNFGESSMSASGAGGAEAEAKLLSMQRDQAERDVRNMEDQLQKVLRREKAVRGILVRQALYGDLRLRPESLEEGLAGTRTLEASDLVGPVLEVTKPLQSFVEQHTIVLQGGPSSSKADLPGFYNPSPLNLGAAHSLYVLYEFRGQLHEVIVGDRETLSVPRRAHALVQGKAPRGPFSPANVALLVAAKLARLSRLAAQGHPSSEQTSSGRGVHRLKAVRASEAEALHQSVSAHLICRLLSPRGRQPRDPGEVTKGEFLFVSLAAGAALVAAVHWARKR